MANLHFQIFDKSGNSLFGPAANNTLWSGFGGIARRRMRAIRSFSMINSPIAGFLPSLPPAGRRFLSVSPSRRQAIRPDPISDTPFRPELTFQTIRKVACGPTPITSARASSANGANFVGVGAYALDRAQALAGDPNPTIVGFLAPPTPAYVVGDGLLPSSLDGQTPPPAGSPNFFVGSQDDNGPYGAPSDGLTFWKFHYDPSTPGNSTFAMTTTLATQPFNSIFGPGAAVAVNAFRSRSTNRKIDFLVTGSGRCFGLPIATLATTNRW